MRSILNKIFAKEQKDIKPKQVIIIDDNYDTAFMIKKVLERSYVKSLMFCNEERAVNYILKYKDEYRFLVILDIKLKKTNGFRVGRYLREKYSIDLPIIYISADDYNRKRYWKIGDIVNTYFLSKPLNIDHFLNVVNKLTRQV